MAINTVSSAKHALPSNQSLRGFFAFNLLLLCFLSFWLFKQNQPISLPTPSLVSDGKMQCISYSPYYQAGVSPLKIDTFITPKQIDEDLAKLSKHTHCVRIYSVSQGLDYVPQAASKLGMKVYLGVWIGWIKSLNDKELRIAINLANQYPNTIKALIVGNEVLLRGEQSELALKRYILKAKAETTVAVTYADVWEFWRKHPALEESVDFVTVHILPYWEDHPQPIEQALEHTNAVMKLLGQSFKKPILIGETGWPSAGRTRQESVPSLINQATYIRGFLKLAQEKNWQYNVIEAVDQPWKRNLEGTVGGYWGVFDTAFKAKFLLTGDVQARQDDLKSFLLPSASALLFLALALLLNEKRITALSAIVTMGFLTGLSSLLQVEYLISACRTTSECLCLGGLSALSYLTSLCLIWTISKPGPLNSKILKSSLFIFFISAFITSCLLIFDGRYRDYPVILYLLAAIELSFGLLILKRDFRVTFTAVHLLNVILISAALYCLYLEPRNVIIYLWIVINLMLVLALWPKKDSQI
jgi:exo-beta-1,3-glucanase (GH17 family)